MNFQVLFIVVSAIGTGLFVSNALAEHLPVPNFVDIIQHLSIVDNRRTDSYRSTLASGHDASDLWTNIEVLLLQWQRALALKSLEGMSSANVTNCAQDLLIWGNALRSKKVWALEMLDATGKPSGGLLKGNTRWMGEYNECLNVDIEIEVNGSLVPPLFRSAYCSFIFGNASSPAAALTWDFCVPSSCTNDVLHGVSLLHDVLQLLINGVVLTGDFKALKSSCSDGDSKSVNGKAVVVICLLSILATLVICSSILDIIYQFKAQSISSSNEASSSLSISEDANAASQQGATSERTPLLRHTQHTDHAITNTYGYFVKFLLSFSVFKNATKILSVNDLRQSDGSTLHAIHGIRFLSMSWVILGHTWVFSAGYARNLADALDIIRSFSFQAIMNATVSVDTFFLLSGTLLSYQLLRELTRRSEFVDNETWSTRVSRWIRIIIHRYLRLTPVYMIVLAVFATLYVFWLSGPFVLEAGDVDCSKWWTNLLYINNIAFANNQCIGWSWYLANDMQLFLFSLGLVIIIHRHFTIGILIVSLLMTSSCVITAVITFVNDYPPSPSAMLNYPTVNQANWYRDIYYPPWCRAGPYLVGILLGAILNRCQCKVRLHWVLVIVCWCVAAALSSTVLYGLYNELNGFYMNTAQVAIYAGVHRTIWAIGVAWVIFACVTGYGGLVNTLLSWTGLVPLSRLTYAAYLVHPMVIFWCYGNLRTQLHVTYITMVYMFCGHLLLSYGLAFIVSTTCEAPVINIINLIFKK